MSNGWFAMYCMQRAEDEVAVTFPACFLVDAFGLQIYGFFRHVQVGMR